ncbi:MAG: hypothetical protein JRS35_01985 [Deltaproteobacteria bacterium]|nr:hypothetical protein [Deltaproteobacteria bacterium]
MSNIKALRSDPSVDAEATHAGEGGLSESGALLYQLRRDPAEAYNVAETRPEIAVDLGQRLQAWRSDLLANPRSCHARESGREIAR